MSDSDSEVQVQDTPLLTISFSGSRVYEPVDPTDLFPYDWPLQRKVSYAYYQMHVFERIVDYSSPDYEPTPDDIRRISASPDEFVPLLAEGCNHWLNDEFPKLVKRPTEEITLGVSGVSVRVPGVLFSISAQMIKARCIACISVGQNVPVHEAEEVVEKILADHDLSFPQERVQILVRHDLPLADRVQREMDSIYFFKYSRDHGDWVECSQDYKDLVRRFLHTLELVLDSQVEKGIYSVVMRSPHGPLIDVVDSITKILQDLSGESLFWRPLLGDIKTCVAYCGLPESGKSSMSAATLKDAGRDGVYLKMSYCLWGVRREEGWDEVGDDHQIGRAITNLDQFVSWHGFKVIALGISHPVIVEYLNAFIGHGPNVPGAGTQPCSANGKLRVVYLDTPLELRIGRSKAEEVEILRERDQYKVECGIEKIKDMADLVIDNTGTLEESFAKVSEMLNACQKD